MSLNPISHWREAKKQRFLWGRKGRLESFTKVINPPSGFGDQPYWVGLVRFRNGQKTTAPLVIETVKPKKGSLVEVVWRRVGEAGLEEHLTYGVKLRVIS